MGLIETDETNKFTFEAFASHKFYTDVNRSLVRHALTSISKHPSNNQLTIVDMACGTGAVTRLIAEELASQELQASIIGIDPSTEALRRAQKGMEELQARGIEMKATFIQGETSDLPKFVQNADAVFFATLFTSYLISSLHSNLSPVFLLPMAYLRVTAHFTMDPTSREPNDSIVFGRAALWAGYAESTLKCVYHAR